ncbi:MAG: SRPBCC domain-containing protein [Polyangiaceae bacterium]
MTESVRVSGVVAAAIERVFDAFLESEAHSAMTGGPANVSAVLGTPFSAWDGYITGSNLFLDRPKRIVQSWRASDFPAEANDSMLEILLDERDGGTEITFVHTGLPIGMSRGFLEGWHKYYLEPMQTYFGKAPAPKSRAKASAGGAVKAAAKKTAPKKAAPKKAAPKKAAPKKTAPKKTAPKKTAPKKAAPKKAAPKKAPAKKAPAKKAPAKAKPKKTTKRG